MKTIVSLMAFLCVSTAFAGIEFDLQRKSVNWMSRRDLSPQVYQKTLNEYVKKGYRPVDVEIWADNKIKRYALTMIKDKTPFSLKTSLSSDAFKAKWQEMKNKGYRLIDQESYRFKGKQYYAGLWIKNTAGIGWRSHRNQTKASFKTAFDKNRADGFMPIDVEGYLVSGKRYFSSIWVKNKGYAWKLNKAVPANQFGSYLATLNKEKKRIIDFNSYTENGKIVYAIISVKDNKRTNWAYRLNRSKKNTAFVNRSNALVDSGFRLDAYDMIKLGNSFYYSGLYSVNQPERANWSKRLIVSNKVRKWVNDNKPGGVTAVVAHKGKIRFIKGFGTAGNQIDAHGKTVYRIASISKAISGILGFRLESANKMDLDKNIRASGYLTNLPSKHGGYTVGDLLTCRSEVAHYSTGDAINNGGQYDDAWSAVEEFMDWDLETDDADGYVYSTPGYTIFAAAAEKRTGKNFCDLVKEYVSGPFGAPTLGCEKENRNTKNKSLLYVANNSGNPVVTSNPRNLSWKYSGGGLEASGIDLARIGMKLAANQVMSKSQIEEMTTDPLDGVTSYAYGWNYGSHDGFDWFAKSGAQRGARTYFRVYPDQDLVIVTLSNLWTDGRWEALHEEIALEILK